MGTTSSQAVPTLEELQDWARDPSKEHWRNLIAALTDLLVSNLEADAEVHGDAYAEIVCRLLDDVATEVRKELSQRVAPIDRFPGQVVRRLATDEAAEVATPMLEHSPVLTESDLIGIVEKMLPDHNRAISRRKSLNEKLTDALAKRGDIETVRTMAANPGAKFSPKTYRLVAEKAKTDVGLQESLVERDDLTHIISLQITPFLSEELKARLKALDAKPEGGSLLDSLTEIASESEIKAKQRKERAAIYSLIELVRAGNANASTEALKLIEKDQTTALTHFLAGIAQLSDGAVEDAFANHEGKPLALILRGLGLSKEAATAIGKVRATQLGLPAAELDKWVDTYSGINGREAERLLQMLREKESAGTASRQKGGRGAAPNRHR